MTETPTEGLENMNPSGNFVLEGQVSTDLLATLQEQSTISTLLRNKLKIVQECNYAQMLAAAAASTQADSLGTYIQENMRGATQSSSQLKSATRLFFNPLSGVTNTSLHVIRRLDTELSHPLNVSYRKDKVSYLQSQDAPYTFSNNELVFTRPCKLLLVFSAAWGIWSGDFTYDGQLPPEISSTGGQATPVAPTWRFNASGTNRTVTVTPSFNISGSLSTGSGEVKLQPAAVVFQEQDIYPASLVRQTTFLQLEVLRGSGAFGRVEKLKLTVERTPYVAHFGQATDALGLFKTTQMGNDDGSNFLDVIEL